MDNRRLRTVMATALLLIAGAWTVGAGAENAKQLEKKEGTWVPIIAFTNSPVADADIVITRPNGKVIFEKAHATNQRGFYPAELHPIPKKFRVTVYWVPTRAPYRSLGLVRMSTDVNDYDRANGQVYVNPVTTIVSRLRDRRPELSLARAQAIVRFVLGMPANASLGAALREGPHYQPAYFSESDFIQQAIAYGGFESYIENLVTQAIYHPNEPLLPGAPQSLVTKAIYHPNDALPRGAAQSLGASAATDAAGFVAKSLAQGALSYLAGQGVGWAGTAAGIFEPGATAGDIAQLQAGLEDLQSSVDALSNQLTQSTAQIIAAINYSQYNTLSVQALKLAAQVNVVEQNLTDLADGCPPATSQPAPPLTGYCRNLKATVAKQLSESEINASYEEFAAFLEDTATVGNKGLLHLFSLCVGQSVGHFFRYGDSVKIYDMWNYWDAVETQAANLKVELLHLQGAQDNSSGKNVLLRFLGDASQDPPTNGELQNTHDAEAALLWPLLPPGTVINTEDHKQWLTTYPGVINGYYSPGCKGPLTSPPYGGGGADTQPRTADVLLTPFNGDGAAELPFRSPLQTELERLFNGWQGVSQAPGKWISDQTGTKPGDPPGIKSIGFAPIYQKITGCTSSGDPWVWTFTSIVFGQKYVAISLNDGTTADPNSSIVRLGSYNWVYLVSDFFHQYYWFD